LGELLLREERGRYAKSQIAKALGFSRGSFYYRSRIETKDKEIANEIEYWHEIDDTLGHKKLTKLIGVSKDRIRRVMKKYGIQARRRKKKYRHPGKSDRLFPNLANNEEEQEKYEDIIFSDIFEFKLADGSVVRGCVALRKSTRQVLSLIFDYGMKAELVVETIRGVRVIGGGRIIWHSDQGKQYGANQTVEAVVERGLVPSMSRAGTPTDNPYAERFVGVFKLAVVYRRRYGTLGEFLIAAEKWINFYNNLRPHEGVGQQSPNDRAAEIGLEKVYHLHLF
jgi:putative transposase